MPAITFNFTTDHHFSHRPPGRRQGDYFADLSSKMEQVANHCNSTGSIALFGGDLFHLKDPSKISTPHLVRFMGDMADLLSHFERPPLTAVGNHDIKYDRISTLPEQPLGLMDAAGKVRILCPYDPANLESWLAPSGHTHLIPRVMPIAVHPTGEGSYVLVYSTPYMDDPQDLVAYLGSEIFHESLAKFAVNQFAAQIPQSISCILLLHTLAGTASSEFFGLMRASYAQIHAGLSLSDIGRSTSMVLFGHEHPEMGSFVLQPDPNPPLYKNLPPGVVSATAGTIFVNPASFSRSSLDYNDTLEDPERPVYMVEITYTPSGLGLGVGAITIPLVTRPLAQLFGVSSEADPLNQGGVDVVVASPDPPVWTSFTDALTQLDQTGEDPGVYLATRLLTETPEVVSTVKALLTI